VEFPPLAPETLIVPVKFMDWQTSVTAFPPKPPTGPDDPPAPP
jgi:hypothetical protein